MRPVEPAGGQADFTEAKGPSHTKWNLLSYSDSSCASVSNWNGVTVGLDFELSEGFKLPLTSRAIKAL